MNLHTLSFFLAISLFSVRFPSKSTSSMIPDRINFMTVMRSVMSVTQHGQLFWNNIQIEKNGTDINFNWNIYSNVINEVIRTSDKKYLKILTREKS